MMRVLGFALLCAAALPGQVVADTRGLRDPTRPPAILLTPLTGASVVAAPSGPRLQSILIARHPGGRNIAVIDGIMLRPGDKYKEMVLERMSESEVVLTNGKTRQVLKLFPVAKAEAGSTGTPVTPASFATPVPR